MKTNPVGWFEIYVDDMERAKSFYESVLQTTLSKLDSPAGGPQELWGFPGDMSTVGAAGALVRMQGFPTGANSTLVYFKCDDCAVEAGRVKAAGGSIEKSKYSIGQYGFIALAVDTEGNMFGLHSMS